MSLKNAAFAPYLSKFLNRRYLAARQVAGTDIRVSKSVTKAGAGSQLEGSMDMKKTSDIDMISPLNMAAGAGLLYMAGNPIKRIKDVAESQDAFKKAILSSKKGLLGIGGILATAGGAYLLAKGLQDITNRKGV